MHTRTVRRTPADEPTVTDDPFADLLDELEMEDPLPETDDGQELHHLFSAAPRRAAPATEAPPGSHWPTHNYGPAYRSLRRDHGTRRRPAVIAESELWDVDQLTHEPAPEPRPAEPTHAPWRTPAPPADPTGWLDTLDTGAVAPETTEARLVDLVSGGSREKMLVEATDILHARPRKVVAVAHAAPVRAEPLVPKAAKLAAVGILLLFALAVLQLLLS